MGNTASDIVYCCGTLDLEESYLVAAEPLPDATAHGWFDLDSDGVYDEINDRSHNFKSFNSSTAGAIYVLAEDLVKWSQAVFQEGRVVSEESLAEAMMLQPTTPDEPLLGGYGLGVPEFSPEIFNGMIVVGHSGNAAGCFYLPEYAASVAILTNTHAGEPMPTSFQRFQILADNLEPLDS
jgi:CubicO group peptidase (beta-lactamase class C family)